MLGAFWVQGVAAVSKRSAFVYFSASSRTRLAPSAAHPSQSLRYLRPPAVEVMSMGYEVEGSVCSSQIELLAGGKVTFRQNAHMSLSPWRIYDQTWKWATVLNFFLCPDQKWGRSREPTVWHVEEKKKTDAVTIKKVKV